ncbi:MAG TPA: polysaccharide deacetylase family protein, partial [Ktedonobacteraceae bacterium]|nr:polysaccharide deacetylase family protein [Ktedonobacteraceae bacterium]
MKALIQKGLSKWPFIISSLLLLAVCLTGIHKFTEPLTAIHADPAAWDGNSIHYNVKDHVTYQGNIYSCIQAHTSQPGWNPVSVPALWKFISAGLSTQTGSNSTTSNSQNNSTSAPAWNGNGVHYKAGDQVTYKGKTYSCIQGHTSQPDWNPVDAVSLWEATTNETSSQGSSSSSNQLQPSPISPPPSGNQSNSASGTSSSQTFAGPCTSGPQGMWTPADGVFYQGRTDKKEVALTFDDGPFGNLQTTNNTQAIINILQQYKVHATFFLIGNQVSSDPEQVDQNSDQVKLVNEEKNGGNEVADHTWTHAHLPVLPLTPDPNNPGNKNNVQDEIQMTKTVIKNATGTTATDFRPPYGETNQSVQQQASQLGLPTVGWTLDSCDWTQTLSGGAQKNDIINNVLNFITNGSVVLMHDGGNDRSQTIAALPTIIQSLQKQGYQLVTVQQMVTESH